MKRKAVFIATILFFLALNGTYLLENGLGGYLTLVDIALFILFVFLVVVFFIHIVQAIREKFKDRNRDALVCFLVIVLAIAVLKPEGLFDPSLWPDGTVLKAGRKGVAGCYFSVVLKKDKRFYESSICFGDQKNHGTYYVRHDTVFFDPPGLEIPGRHFVFGVISTHSPLPGHDIGGFNLYCSKTDTMPREFMSLLVNKLE